MFNNTKQIGAIGLINNEPVIADKNNNGMFILSYEGIKMQYEMDYGMENAFHWFVSYLQDELIINVKEWEINEAVTNLYPEAIED